MWKEEECIVSLLDQNRADGGSRDTVILAFKHERSKWIDWKIWKHDNPLDTLTIAAFAYGCFKDMLISGTQIYHANRFISSQLSLPNSFAFI